MRQGCCHWRLAEHAAKTLDLRHDVDFRRRQLARQAKQLGVARHALLEPADPLEPSVENRAAGHTGDRFELELAAKIDIARPFQLRRRAIVEAPAATILHFPYDEYHLPTEAAALVDEQLMDDSIALALALVESQLSQPIPR